MKFSQSCRRPLQHSMQQLIAKICNRLVVFYYLESYGFKNLWWKITLKFVGTSFDSVLNVKLLVCRPWNNGKSGAKLDLTSSTTPTPGLQINTVDHTRTANPCDWLPCRRATLLLVGCPHSLVYLHLPVVEGLIFCISATPHLGTSFPLFHALTTR